MTLAIAKAIDRCIVLGAGDRGWIGGGTTIPPGGSRIDLAGPCARPPLRSSTSGARSVARAGRWTRCDAQPDRHRAAFPTRCNRGLSPVKKKSRIIRAYVRIRRTKAWKKIYIKKNNKSPVARSTRPLILLYRGILYRVRFASQPAEAPLALQIPLALPYYTVEDKDAGHGQLYIYHPATAYVFLSFSGPSSSPLDIRRIYCTLVVELKGNVVGGGRSLFHIKNILIASYAIRYI